MQVYLDHAATTPIKKVAMDAWVQTASIIGNPSGSHKAARIAKDKLEEARESFAKLMRCAAREVIFTSGGTESDNLAILGSASKSNLTLCSAIEHHAVLEPISTLGGKLMKVTPGGALDLDKFDDFLFHHGSGVGLVSVMTANNETGVVQPLAEVVKLARKYAPDALLHTDAIQTPSYLDVEQITRDFDLVSFSAHKFGGPKGVGALIARQPNRLRPIIFGGGQEWELRSGTQNLAGIVSMTVALEDAVANREANALRVRHLTDILRSGLSDKFDGIKVNGNEENQMGNISNYCFEGLNSEEILFLLDASGVYASAGSSCASGALNPSHVLMAMGKSKEQAKGSLRLSLGPQTTEDEITFAVETVAEVVSNLTVKKGLKCI